MTLNKKTIYLALFGMLATGATNAVQLLDPPSAPKITDITVFVAKKVVTMDPSLPTATAVAVADGKILSVGTLEDLKPWTSKYPTTINRQFANQVIYPGFVEAHAHPLLGAIFLGFPLLTPSPVPSPWGQGFPGVPNFQAAMNQLKQYSESIQDPNKILIAWGYDEKAMGSMPDRKLLDGISATRPIAIWNDSGHNMYVNSGLLKAYGITPDAVKGVPGVGMDKDGQLNGQFIDMAAMEYLMGFIGKEIFNPNTLPRAIMFSNDLMQQHGVTTSGDMALGAIDIDVELEANKAFTSSKNTSIRIVEVAYSDPFVKKYGDQAPQKVADLSKLNTDRQIFQGVKFFSDAGFLPETMYMNTPGYTDGHLGSSTYKSAQEFAATMKPWWDAGFHIHIHSNGDGGNQNSLNALQLLQDSKPRFDHRYTIEHFGVPTTAMVMKVKSLGAVVSANITYMSERADLEAPGIGVDRASYVTRIGNLMRSGVVTAIHSDYPAAMFSPDPLGEVGAAVTRLSAGTGSKRWAPAEALPVSEALKMVTINAAYTLGVEDKVGTIEAGKYADFTVLGDDPQTVPATKIKDVPIVATVLGGRVIPVSETKKPRPLN